MASITLDTHRKPIGFHLTPGGPGLRHQAAREGPSPMRFLKQAYIDVKPALWKAIDSISVKFVSFASAEVIERK